MVRKEKVMRKNIIYASRFLFSFIMIFVFAFICFTSETIAATTYTEGYYYYEVQDESIVITGYFGSDTEITVPARIAGYPVSKIASGAFSHASTVKKINLPDTIMTIEEGAFALEQTIVYNSNMNNQEQPTNPKQPTNSERPTTAEQPTNSTQPVSENTSANQENTNADKSNTNVQQGEKPGSVEEVDIDLDDADSSIASSETKQVLPEENTATENSNNENEGNQKDKKSGIIVVIILAIVILGAIAGAGFFCYNIKRRK